MIFLVFMCLIVRFLFFVKSNFLCSKTEGEQGSEGVDEETLEIK